MVKSHEPKRTGVYLGEISVQENCGLNRVGTRAAAAWTKPERKSVTMQDHFGYQPGFGLSGVKFSGIGALCLGLMLAAGTAARSQEGAVTPESATPSFTTVDVPGAGTNSQQGTAVSSINAAGDITGVYVDANNVVHGFVLPAGGTLTKFDVPAAGTKAGQGTIPASINSSGTITGVYVDGNIAAHGFVRAANGTITTIDAPGAPTATKDRGTSALGINDSGTIIGMYSTTGSISTPPTYHSFLRTAAGKITVIDEPNAGSGVSSSGGKEGTYVSDINASGEMVGSYIDSNYVEHGFLLSTTGTFTSFDPPSGAFRGGAATSFSIDSAGDVAGDYYDASDVHHGFLRAANGTFTPLDAPVAHLQPCSSHGMGKSFCGTMGAGVDAAGDVAGAYVDSNGIVRGFLRPAGTSAITTFSDPNAGSYANEGTLPHSMISNGKGIMISGMYADTNFVLHGFVYAVAAAAPVATTTTVTSSLNPSVYQQPATFTAKVTSSNGAPPNGENVTFYSGTTALGTGQLSGGSATTTTTALPVGTDSITASYAGDANFANSKSSALTQVVNKAKSYTALASNSNPSSFGQPVVFTATVTGQFGGTASGTVTFSNGTKAMGTVTLSKGAASISAATLAVGSDSITAVYSGDTNFVTSTSNAVKQVVNQGSTTTALTSSLNPSKSGQPVTLTAAVTGKYGGTPSGSVAFKDGNTTLKTVTLSGGVAKYTTSTLTKATHSMTAVYSGDANFNGSTGSVSQKVN